MVVFSSAPGAVLCVFVFFFSSRRRHTRLVSDWSSDVCSSDLWLVAQAQPTAVGVRVRAEHLCMSLRGVRARGAVTTTFAERGALADDPALRQKRSEERRVGKEGRTRGGAGH